MSEIELHGDKNKSRNETEEKKLRLFNFKVIKTNS